MKCSNTCFFHLFFLIQIWLIKIQLFHVDIFHWNTEKENLKLLKLVASYFWLILEAQYDTEAPQYLIQNSILTTYFAFNIYCALFKTIKSNSKKLYSLGKKQER